MRIVCLILMALLSNCSCQTKNLIVNQILVDRLPSVEGSSIDRDAIKKETISILNASKFIKVQINEKPTATLRVRLRLSPQPTVDLKYTAQVNGELRQSFGSASADTFENAIKFAVNDWLSSSIGQGQDTREQLAIVKRDLAGQSVSEAILLQAIHALGTKGNFVASPFIAKELQSSNEKVALAALSSLTCIEDPSTIEAIESFAERKPVDVRKQAILAGRQIGGIHAAAWLFTLSTGHEDGEVRDAASKALSYVEGRLKK